MIHMRCEGQIYGFLTDARCGLKLPRDQTTGTAYKLTCKDCIDEVLRECTADIVHLRQRITMLKEIREKAN